MLEGIFFNENAMQFHHRLVSNCVSQFSAIKAHPQLLEMNQVKGKGLTIGQMLVALSNNLKLFLNQPDTIIKSTANLSNQPLSFLQAIRIARIDSMTYSTYLAQTLDQRSPHAAEHSNELLSPFRGYFLLLAAINAFNLALDMHQQNKQDKAIELVVAALKWLEDLELNHLPALSEAILYELREELVTKISTLQVAISIAQGSQVISAKDLQFMVERKNQRAARFRLPYFGEVICAPTVANCYLPDPQALQLLYDNIQAMVSSNKTQRKQILFYYNLATGHVELLDVAFDATIQKLFLINISSTHLASQHYFLQQLVHQLHARNLRFDIIACQTDIQRDGISCLLYAYALSGIVARSSYAKLLEPKFATRPPTFFDVSHQEGHILGEIPNVRWCTLHALSPKVSLMSQSFTFMETSLRQFYNSEEVKSLIADFKTKYGLVNSEELLSKRTYIDYLRNHFARCLHPEAPAHQITMHGLRTKYKVKAPDIDNGQMARRAVVYGTTDEFDVLLEHFSQLTLEDNPLDAPDKNKGLTPIWHALQRQTPGRALKLLATEKVSLEKASEHFTKLPEASLVKQNETLRKYLTKVA